MRSLTAKAYAASRFRRIKRKILLPRFLREMKKLEIGGLSAGNSTKLITDGDVFFDSLLKDIRSAKKSINLETYIFASDKIGWMIAEELAARAKAGVEVNCIYDAVGSIASSQKMFSLLKRSGAELISYHPFSLFRKLSSYSLRDHRKIIVIDGITAYVGGINISSDYAGKKYSGGGWRDTHLRIQGPAVKDIQFFFMENWYRHGGSILNPSKHFPEIRHKGKKILMVISTRSRKNIRPILESYLSAIKNAKKSIYITNAYFIPDRRVFRLMAHAAKRGVDVQLILPGESDVPLVKHASRYLYRYYLKHGIKVYEYQDKMLHAKTAVIDGLWSTIGSSNLDRLSLYVNLELNAVVLDEEFGDSMNQVFMKDMEKCKRISAEQYKQRSMPRFMIEWFAYRFRNLL